MKQDRISKMYEGLSSKELAVLSFHCMTDMNELERERVAGAVPVKAYICPDLIYRRWLDGLCNMASLYAIEYWHLYSRSLEATVAMHVMEEANLMDKAKSAFEASTIWKSRLLALDCALLIVSEEYGIDPDAVRSMAGSKHIIPMRADIKPDAAHQAELQKNMEGLLGR